MTIDTSLHPRHQTELLSHELPLSVLTQAFDRGGLLPIWLIAGAKGIGKATMVYHFLRHLWRDNDVALHQMHQGSYPNLSVLEAGEDSFSADDVRGLLQQLRQTAALPGWRVVIVDSLEALNKQGANALLKTLEEPPAQTLFFLITHQLANVLPTIRSRAAILNLTAPTQQEYALSPLVDGLGQQEAFRQVGGVDFYDRILKLLPFALQGKVSSLQPHIESLADEKVFEMTLHLMEMALYRLVVLQQQPLTYVSSNEEGVFQQLREKTITHWLWVQDVLSRFIREARVAHLDRKHLLWACLFLFENPGAFDG